MEAALDTRDALAKSIYAALFRWELCDKSALPVIRGAANVAANAPAAVSCHHNFCTHCVRGRREHTHAARKCVGCAGGW